MKKEEAHLPGIRERHHMININIRRSGPGSSIVRTVPCATSGSTRGALDDVRAVAFENDLASVAGTDLSVTFASSGISMYYPLWVIQ
jgi:hypothetical protein